MYNVTFYINTGFNSLNSPDSTALLENAAYNKVTVPALDLYQIQELETIRVNVSSYSSIRDADYALIVNDEDSTDFGFFSIESIDMTDMHTAVVSLLINPTLTVVGPGGVGVLEFTDGICSRHHVSTNDDNFGAYCEEDPYMTPAETMQIEQAIPNFNEFGPNYQKEAVLLVTTADLYNTWVQFNRPNAIGEAPFALDYKSSVPGSDVVVPFIPASKITTRAVMENSQGANPYFDTVMANMTVINADQDTSSPKPATEDNSWLFPGANNPYDGLGIARGLGLESTIIAQYAIPYYMIAGTQYVSGQGASNYANKGIIQTLVGNNKIVELPTLAFKKPYSTTVHNNRIFYGETAKYTIISIASGNQASFLPEEIYDNYDNPYIEMKVDPRPNGCPYFRFPIYRGIYDDTLFFSNAVRGLQWQNVPITYELASGAILNEYAYNAAFAVRENASAHAIDTVKSDESAAKIRAFTNTISSALQNAGNAFSAKQSDSNFIGRVGAAASAFAGDLISNISEASIAKAQSQNKVSMIEDEYRIEVNKELQSLLLSNYAVAPSIYFPVSEGIRDYVGNTCIVYRYRFTENDVARIDKILTMYGYKHTTPIVSSFLTNRTKFNYIEAKGVAIKNVGVPKWLRDAVTAQFAAGVRFWHVPIDTTAYTDGSNT